MLSKMVTDRLKDAGQVLSAMDTLKPRIAARAAEVLGPYLRQGEQLPDVALLATLLGRLFEDRMQQMERADVQHNDELSDDGPPREAREASTRELYAAVVEIKGAVETLFGKGWHARLKLPREVPQDPTALWRLAGEISEALGKVALPKPVVKAVKRVDPEPWVEQLEGPRERLGHALADVAREAREAQATQIAKNRAVSAYDEAFSTCVAFGAALLRLVGEHEHAERLRPSARRPGTLEEDEAPAGEPAAGGAP